MSIIDLTKNSNNMTTIKFYNMILKNSDGDSLLVAQTSEPHRFVCMNHPHWAESTDSNEEQITWGESGSDDGPHIVAALIKDVKLNVLLPEGDADKLRY